LEPLGPFKSRAPIGNLPKVSKVKPTTVQLQHHPRYKYPAQSLLRAIDIENRLRYDVDGRSELFFSETPVELGSILIVDMVSSRITPQRRSFAGVLMGFTSRGLTSNLTLRTISIGVGVEMKIPIYSPMITKITLVKGPSEELLVERGYVKNPKAIDFEQVENIVLRFRNQQSRLDK
jgi:ribosomal protein L19